MGQARRVLVTGGGGFVGSRLVNRLVVRGDDVRVFQRFGRSVSKDVRFAQGDIRDPESVRTAVRDCEVVFHLAGAYHAADPAGVDSINADGTRIVAEACAAEGVGRLVHVSTAEVYGNPERVPCPETAALRPLTRYASSKLAGERAAELVHRETGLPTTVLRPTTIVGSECLHPILWCLFENVRRRRTQALIGDGAHRIHLVDADDAADAVAAAACDPEPFGVYNVAGPDAVPLREACRMVYEVSGAEPQVRPLSEPEGHMVGRVMVTTMRLELLGTYLLRADADFVLDTRGARERLGWSARRGTSAILAAAYRAHADAIGAG